MIISGLFQSYQTTLSQFQTTSSQFQTASSQFQTTSSLFKYFDWRIMTVALCELHTTFNTHLIGILSFP